MAAFSPMLDDWLCILSNESEVSCIEKLGGKESLLVGLFPDAF